MALLGSVVGSASTAGTWNSPQDVEKLGNSEEPKDGEEKR